jgi:thiol-disulfide isomerase/thioredoxin
MNIIKRGWKYLIIVIALGLFALLGNADETITIDNLTLGELLMGEGVDKEDLKDHVVAIEFWGYNCPPCRKSIPHMNELVKKYGPKGLILIGIHRQNEPKEKVVALCKSLKVIYPIYQSGDIKGVSFSGVPHFNIFNHRGEMVFDGHPSAADKILDDTMKNAPDPLVGEGPYKKLKSLADQISQHKGFGNIMSQLRKKAESADADEKAEANKLMERLISFANKSTGKAEKKKLTEPLNAFNLYQEIAALFKGDEIGNNAEKTVKSLKEDKTFQENMNADKELAQIMDETEKLKNCNKCKAFNKDCLSCQEKNPAWNTLRQRTEGLIKKYPDSPAAVKAKELLPNG